MNSQAAGNVVLADLDANESSNPIAAPSWQPRWTVDIGHGDRLGLTTDDGCLVVLYPKKDGSWRPGTHIPKPVAERIAQLVGSGVIR
jgi:hypothetical protein